MTKHWVNVPIRKTVTWVKSGCESLAISQTASSQKQFGKIVLYFSKSRDASLSSDTDLFALVRVRVDYGTVFAVSAAVDRRGEGASLGVTLRLHHRVAQIKVYKQRQTPKVALGPQPRSF